MARADGHDGLYNIHCRCLQRTNQCCIKFLIHVGHHCDLCEYCWIQSCHKDDRDRRLVRTDTDKGILTCAETSSISAERKF